MHRVTAVIELPCDNLQQAAAALLGHLRHMLAERLDTPAAQPVQVMDWDTLTITGPAQLTEGLWAVDFETGFGPDRAFADLAIRGLWPARPASWHKRGALNGSMQQPL